MSQMNRGEALRCIQIAKKCIQQNKLSKAEKFLHKSLRMYDTVEAKQLLESLKNPQQSQPPPSNTNTNTNTNTNRNTNTYPPPQPQPQPQPQPTQSSQSTPNLNRNSTASASTSSIGSQSSSRMTRDEEVSMVRKILRAKDYYSILGISKDADEKQMKKAYRKKALKCHPDRNKAPGAEEAFKKLSKAYDCLRDSRQRQIYDQYGEDSPQMRSHGHSAQFQQMTPDDIIRMFFGGDFGGHSSGFHFHTGFPQQRRQSHSNRNTETTQGGPMVYIMQLLPIILVFFTMILPSLMMFGGSSSSTSNNNNSSGGGGGLFGRNNNNNNMGNVYFSLDKQHPFTLEKKTNLGTIYYTQPQRRGTWGYQRYKPHRLESQVESTYLNKLINQCEQQIEKENGRMEKIQSNKINAKQRQKLLKKLMKNKRKLGKWENKQCKKLFEYIGEL